MATNKGSQQAVERREHDLEKEARRVVTTDPFGGVVTEGNFTQKVEKVDSATTYIGVAQIGTSAASAGWQIYKVTVSGTVTSIEWAEGTDAFTNIWNDRATYTYS